jgi:hypothetical protein
MSKETLNIVRENDHFRLDKSAYDSKTLETAMFQNQSNLDCVVWFDDPATFGTQAILVGAARHCELKFNRPLVETRYTLVEWLRFKTAPDPVPGGERLKTSPDMVPGLASPYTAPETIPGGECIP